MGTESQIAWKIRCDECSRLFVYNKGCLIPQNVFGDVDQGVKRAEEAGWKVDGREVICPECLALKKSVKSVAEKEE